LILPLKLNHIISFIVLFSDNIGNSNNKNNNNSNSCQQHIGCHNDRSYDDYDYNNSSSVIWSGFERSRRKWQRQRVSKVEAIVSFARHLCQAKDDAAPR